MADYQKMYAILFNANTDAVKILQAAQLETEKMYVEHDPDNVVLLTPDEGEGDDG